MSLDAHLDESVVGAKFGAAEEFNIWELDLGVSVIREKPPGPNWDGINRFHLDSFQHIRGLKIANLEKRCVRQGHVPSLVQEVPQHYLRGE